MGSAKQLHVRPISATVANTFIKKQHYSGKVVPNSQLHFGVFWNNILEGVMQYGPSINKKGSMRLVEGTGWNEFIELNRMAFSEVLPRNSESRAIAVGFRLIKQHYPHIKWVISFADATQCGDGTIYRASGFLLTDIRKNDALRVNPETGEQMHIIQAHHKKLSNEFRTWQPLDGYQLRYVYLLYPELMDKLTVPVIPYSKIAELGISMYKGCKSKRVPEVEQ